jgi:hypothetical protein
MIRRIFLAGFLAGSLLTPQPALSFCGFTANNDYICDGGGGAPAGAAQERARPFPVPKTTKPSAPNTYKALPGSGIDYQAELRKIQAQMEADRQRLEEAMAAPPHGGGAGGPGSSLSSACGGTSAAPGNGTVYYVSPNGSDGNPCTESAPCSSLANAVRLLQPGDTLYLRGGTYDEAINQFQMPSGTASAPITIAAYPGETVRVGNWPMMFFGPSSGTSHVIIDGIHFTNGLYMGGGGQPYGPSHITVQNFEVSGGSSDGVTVSGSNNIFRNGKVHDNTGTGCVKSHGSASFCHGFYVLGSDHIIENVEVYNTTGIGIKIGQEPGATNVIVRNNVIHHWGLADSSAAILFAALSSNSMAYNNIIYGCTGPTPSGNQQAGISFWRGDNNAAFNNTVYVPDGTCGHGIGMWFGNNSLIQNNIIVTSPGVPAFYDYGGGSNTLSGNLATTTDPGFVNSSQGDFRLQPGSTAIDAGTALPQLTTDFDCASRPAGRGIDIGAYEFQ